jgi:hypothetical protein
MTVSMLLSEMPRSFVWDRVDVVTAVLDHAEMHGRECLRRVMRDLRSLAESGVRERTPGKPSADDTRQQEQGAALAAELPWDSPGRVFYRDLARTAETRISMMALIDEEWDEE